MKRVGEFIQRADMLIARAEEVQNTKSHLIDNPYFQERHVDSAEQEALRAAVLSFSSQVFGSDHIYTRELDRVSKDSNRQNMREVQKILRSARDELAGGWFTQVRHLVSAEIFSDFLEMADHLLSANYIHPAAVIVGSVLEEHLRQLAVANGIALDQTTGSGDTKPKKADTLNAELAKHVYTKLDQKNVTAWLDLRNKAAHGKSGEYTPEQVKNMYSGVTEFVARVTP